MQLLLGQKHLSSFFSPNKIVEKTFAIIAVVPFTFSVVSFVSVFPKQFIYTNKTVAYSAVKKIVMLWFVLLLVPRIRITRPCDKYPLTSHFYMVKLGFTGVYIIFYFCSET